MIPLDRLRALQECWVDRADDRRLSVTIETARRASRPVRAAVLRREAWAWTSCAVRLANAIGGMTPATLATPPGAERRLRWLCGYLERRGSTAVVGGVYALAASELRDITYGSSFDQGVSRSADHARGVSLHGD